MANEPENASEVKKRFEFGGPLGVTSLMLWSHYILLYFWYCLETNSGGIIIPLSVDSLLAHVKSAGALIMAKGIPSVTTWTVYGVFFSVQILLASFMPGMVMEGLPTAPHGKRLKYLCNGHSCYYFCMFGALLVHFTGIFKMTYVVDNYGEFLIASMIIGDLSSLGWYLYGRAVADKYNGQAAWTGNFFYDFFMGTILYPRIGIVDIKMVAEARWSWITLMLLTASCALKQYEETGTISSQMAFMVLAHWMYSNATVKGEHLIPCTWDMFRERFGWMLNFWNVSGVPFLYCFQSLYILKNQATISANYPFALTIFDFLLLIVGYYVFDSANAQKANIKIKVQRNLFPQVPWGRLEGPIRYLVTPKGRLLVDGWYAFARKLQYSGDIMMALSWGLATGFHSPLPYFYCLFFTCMINHRQLRDEARCKEKYGEWWDIYTQAVPNVFFPSGAFYNWLLTGEHPLDKNPHITKICDDSESDAAHATRTAAEEARVRGSPSAARKNGNSATPVKRAVTENGSPNGHESPPPSATKRATSLPTPAKTPSKRMLKVLADGPPSRVMRSAVKGE